MMGWIDHLVAPYSGPMRARDVPQGLPGKNTDEQLNLYRFR